MPSSRQVRMTRTAISPRLAMRTLVMGLEGGVMGRMVSLTLPPIDQAPDLFHCGEGARSVTIISRYKADPAAASSHRAEERHGGHSERHAHPDHAQNQVQER